MDYIKGEVDRTLIKELREGMKKAIVEDNWQYIIAGTDDVFDLLEAHHDALRELVYHDVYDSFGRQGGDVSPMVTHEITDKIKQKLKAGK